MTNSNTDFSENISELNLYQKGLLAVLFAVFIIIGINIAGDYGVPWDDHLQISITKLNYEQLIQHNNHITKHAGKMFGTAFELPLYILQQSFDKYSDQVYLRHIITHLFFILSLFFLFKLLYALFNSFELAILGVVFLYFNPIFFANSFYNTKDIPFLSAFIISLYTLFLFSKTRHLKVIVYHAFISAFLIDIRVSGFIIPILSILIILYKQTIQHNTASNIKKIISYLFLMSVLIILLWPALWNNPIMIYHTIFHMTHYPSEVHNLFNGQLIICNNNPWYYIPTWILISTPIITTILYLIGLIKIIYDTITLKFIISNNRKIVYTVFSLLPISIIILGITLNSTLYDTWRHLFFIYPLIIIGAIYGLKFIVKSFLISINTKIFIYSFTLLFAIIMSIQIIKIHPHEQVYLNNIISKENNSIRQNWEMDYWGLSYKQGFEKLLSIDPNNYIKVKVQNVSAIDNCKLINEKDNRIIIVDSISKADYFITNYRFHPQEYNYKKIDSIYIQGSCMLGIYKLNNK